MAQASSASRCDLNVIKLCSTRSPSPSGSLSVKRLRLLRTTSTSRYCCCCDRSRSISTLNGDPVKKSVSSKPNRRCQSRSSSLSMAIGPSPRRTAKNDRIDFSNGPSAPVVSGEKQPHASGGYFLEAHRRHSEGACAFGLPGAQAAGDRGRHGQARGCDRGEVAPRAG